MHSKRKTVGGGGCRGAGSASLQMTLLRAAPQAQLQSCGTFQKAKLNVERLKPSAREKGDGPVEPEVLPRHRLLEAWEGDRRNEGI